MLQVGLAVAAASIVRPARAEDDPGRDMRPQAGDQFVFFWGDREGQVIAPADVPLGGPLVLAWAMDPKTKLPRDGSRLNQVLLIRLERSNYGRDEQPLVTEDGIAAFSAICTHQQCTVSDWIEESQRLHCVCHGSEYDPKLGADAVFGPAPRALPGLPVKIVDGALVVAGGFNSRVGGQTA